MATKNAINNRSGSLTTDPGASGDSFVQFDINTTGEFRIGVDDTDDSFRISQGSALGTNDTFVMTAAGERTMPLQPAFLAYNSAVDVNVTGDGTVATIEFNTVVYDQGADYNNGTDTFTAPITGKFSLETGVYSIQYGVAHSDYILNIITSNGTFSIFECDPSNVRRAGGAAAISMNGAIFADMDTGDTAIVQLTVSGSTLTIDIFGSAQKVTFFSGSLTV